MKSRMVPAIVIVLLIGIVSHGASSQSIATPPVPCNQTSDCQNPHLPSDARCVSGFCTCVANNGTPEHCPMTHSQPKAAVHDFVAVRSCKLDQDCRQLANGTCNTTVNQCVCLEGFVMAKRTYNCLPISRTIGSPCSQPEQCTVSNSTCRNRQCACTSGFHYNENGCWRTVEIGKSCATTQECSHVTSAVCSELSTCTCADNFVLNSDRRRCLPVVKEMLGECIESDQCSKSFEDAVCIDKRCECKKDNHFAQAVSRCLISRNLGDSCSDSYECYQDKESGETDEPQSCVDNVCTCNENFRKDGDKCVRSGASLLGPVLHITVLLSALLFSVS